MEQWSQNTKSIPFDMLSKYLEHQLRTAYVAGLLVGQGLGKRMCVLPEKCDEFLQRFFDPEDLATWPSTYAGGAHYKSHGL